MKEECLFVDKDLAAQLQSIIDKYEQYPDVGRDAVIHTFTINFGDGIEADIKVCNGDTGPWVDAVLFDQGHEVQVLEPSTILLGDYPFRLDDEDYLGHLEVKE